MDLTAARSFIFGAYLEDTAQKLAEARQREAFILVKGLILNILLNPETSGSHQNGAAIKKAPEH